MADGFGVIMAEMEFAGIKFKGGKIFVILTALTTLGGGLWGGFEFYKDYLNMKEQIQNYVAPDLSGFDKKLAVTEEQMKKDVALVQTEVDMIMSEMEMMMQEIRLVSDVANELKNDLKDDVRRIETIVEDVETRVKEDARSNEKDLKETIDSIENDMEKLEDKINESQKELEEKMDKRIKTALENPLGAM